MGIKQSVPGWIGNGNYFSDDNLEYQTRWILAAKKYYYVDVDYIGVPPL